MVRGMENDYLVVDDLITVEVDNRNGTVIEIPNAYRFNVTLRDIRESAGVLLASDAWYAISFKETNVQPGMRWRIKGTEEFDWNTIMGVKIDYVSQLWKYWVRNWGTTGAFTDVLSIQKRTVTQGPGGTPEYTYVTEHEAIDALIVRADAAILEKYGLEESEVNYIAYFDYPFYLDHSHVIIKDSEPDVKYLVVSWKNIDSVSEPYKVFLRKLDE